MSRFPMPKLILATMLAFGSLLSVAPAHAQNNTRDQVRMIEQEYSRQSNGREISDDQLEYYIDRSNAGWSMTQISQDMANSRRQYANNPWRPQSGWAAREVICSSINNMYRECNAPFRGRAVVTQQLSDSACVEGRSWGEKPGLIWVNRGCRARFGIVGGNAGNPGNNGDNRTITCQSTKSRYRQCDTGIRGRVQLVNRLNNSAACIEGRTWGRRTGQVWVSRGCRAQFASIGRPGPRDDNGNNNGNNGGWDQDNNYSVICSSQNNAMTRCNWDSRYGAPRVVQTLSQSSCTEGRSWGYDNRNGLWVNGGCRAKFGSR